LEVTHVHRKFPGNPVIVSYAPQCELLERSVVAITHAGLNTTMEALGAGVPMVAIPTNAGDQSGVAARIRLFGVGQVLGPKSLRSETLHAAISALLDNPSYRHSAQQMKMAIERTHGAEQAAKIIDRLL